MKKEVFIFFVCLFIGLSVSYSQNNYLNASKSAIRPIDALPKVEDSLAKQFAAQKLVWPPVSMYIRSFKYDRQLEVWIKSDASSPYKLFKTYKVCMQSGTMGPKRMEGDYQVPEGFYYINDFNANSTYHLSLGLNYPNPSDKILSDPTRPGGFIYIHGNCVSTGCIAISDAPIEEVFALASVVKSNGQEFIPVHVFPVRYNNKTSLDYLNNTIKDNLSLQLFNKNIKGVFDFFELKKEIPVILINKKGEYVIN